MYVQGHKFRILLTERRFAYSRICCLTHVSKMKLQLCFLTIVSSGAFSFAPTSELQHLRKKSQDMFYHKPPHTDTTTTTTTTQPKPS